MATRQIRPIRVEGNIAYVTLTRGLEAIIDAADVPLVEGRNWCALVQRHGAYAVAKGEKSLMRMHRIIARAPDGMEVDHVSGDGLDNRQCNLRLATASQNRCNARLRSNNTSGFKGVTWDKYNRKWRAQIKWQGQVQYLGCYADKMEAQSAYAAASEKIHGAFGRAC